MTNPSIASGLVPTNLTNELIFGYTVGGSGATAAGSGFKQRQVVSNDLSEDKVVAASGLYQTTFTQTSGNSSWVALMATFKSGASTGETLMASSTASTATGRIKLRLSAGAAQPAGTYTNLITYTIYAAY